jgi:hypothetical protein
MNWSLWKTIQHYEYLRINKEQAPAYCSTTRPGNPVCPAGRTSLVYLLINTCFVAGGHRIPRGSGQPSIFHGKNGRSDCGIKKRTNRWTGNAFTTASEKRILRPSVRKTERGVLMPLDAQTWWTRKSIWMAKLKVPYTRRNGFSGLK